MEEPQGNERPNAGMGETPHVYCHFVSYFLLLYAICF